MPIYEHYEPTGYLWKWCIPQIMEFLMRKNDPPVDLGMGVSKHFICGSQPVSLFLTHTYVFLLEGCLFAGKGMVA